MKLATKVFAIASATALGFGMTACGAGDTEANSDTTRIGVSVYDMSSFITAGKEGMDQYAKTTTSNWSGTRPISTSRLRPTRSTR